MATKVKPPSFWLTNISSMNISLSDLNLTIRAYSSINLLDSRHYAYTLEQLQKSVESGSVFKKRNKLVVRKVSPEILTANMALISETFIPTRERSVFNIKEEYYPELDVKETADQKASDEKFAAENAEIADLDTKIQIVSKE